VPDARGIKHIPLSRAKNLPRLKAPAGYVVVLEDVDLGDRFKIVIMQAVNDRALASETSLSFETRLFLTLSAADAEALALDLYDRFATGGDFEDWFDLDRAQANQLRNFGRPSLREVGQPSLRDLALSEATGRARVAKPRMQSAAQPAPPRQTQPLRPRPQRRWATWLLLLAIVALGALVLGNAPQLRQLINELTNLPATSGSSPTPFARAGDVFYVLVRANARVCASRDCRAAEILEVGTRISAQRHERGQAIDGNSVWVVFVRRGAILFVHSSVLSRQRPAVNAAARPSATASFAAVPSATVTETAMQTDTPAPTNTDAPAASATNTGAPTATAEPTETALPPATATLRSTATAVPEATATNESMATREPTAPATGERKATATPTATATLEPTATAEATETALKPETATKASTVTATLEPTATATREPTVIATDLPAVLYIDTANNLNALVRACPSTDCEILGRLRPGAAINPTGEAAGEVVNGIALWVVFEYDGRPAYVHGELVAEGVEA